ncbi:hypothetical protein Hamer_G027937, partial [Homarus americanus]
TKSALRRGKQQWPELEEKLFEWVNENREWISHHQECNINLRNETRQVKSRHRNLGKKGPVNRDPKVSGSRSGEQGLKFVVGEYGRQEFDY